MRVGILGRVAVWDDQGDEVRLRPQIRRLIGLLVATDGPISIDQISEYVAGGQRSGSAARTAAGRLRSVVGDRLVTVGSSYELALEPDELDATIFQSLRERAADARPNERVDLLSSALECWRGAAFGDLAGEEWAAPAAARLDQLRVDAVGDLAEALIDVGKWSDAVTLLEPHLADVPYQERPIALLMRALAGSGRVTDALRRFRQFTVELRNDIGVGPSQSLSALEFDLLSEADPRPDDAGGSIRPRAPSSSSNISEPMSSFVGRVDEVKGLVEELGSKRLITLVGPGGAGKTRLALRVAAESTEEFVDGSWFVDLAQIDDERDVEILAAATLGAKVEPGASPTEGVIDHLRDRRVLVIVDNCEHVTHAAASLIREVLSQCPSIGVLATSRERLAVDGEQVHPVVGLDDFEAHALFCERAAQADDRFEVSDDDGLVIDRICRRLDGIPLAIELAAARTRSLTPTDLLERLDDRLRLLRSGPSTNDRHASLSATVQWSYEMLDDDERTAFDRLSVFSGDFDLAAASAVVSLSGDFADVLEILDSLVDKSLVVADRSQRHTRYRLLESLRMYGVERLMERGESEVTRRRHGDHYLSVSQAVRSANDAAAPFRDLGSFVTIHSEWHNFRTAVNWALEDDDPGRAAVVALISEVFYLFLEEHAGWMDRILARLPDEHPLASICHAYAALWNTLRGDNAAAFRTGYRGLEIEDGLGGVAHRLLWRAISEAHLNTGDPVEGLAAARRSLLVMEGSQSDYEVVDSLILALACSLVAEPHSAVGFADRLASAALDAPSSVHTTAAVNAAGFLCLGRDDVDGALDHFRRSSQTAAGIPHLQGVALRNLAVAAAWSEFPQASSTIGDALDQLVRSRFWSLGWVAVEALAISWGRSGRATDATVLLGYLDHHGLGYGLLVDGRHEVTARVADLSGADEQRATGAAMGRDDLMAFALDGLRAGS
jgi:predicted ATPase/DNA-binding SARP family transcriptional activator